MDQPELSRAARVYVLGDKFDSPKVKTSIIGAFGVFRLPPGWETVDWKLDDVTNALELIWTSVRNSDLQVKESLLDIISKEKINLMASKIFRQTVQSHGDLAFDVLKQLKDDENDRISRERFICRDCWYLNPTDDECVKCCSKGALEKVQRL